MKFYISNPRFLTDMIMWMCACLFTVLLAFSPMPCFLSKNAISLSLLGQVTVKNDTQRLIPFRTLPVLLESQADPLDLKQKQRGLKEVVSR